MLPTKLTPEKMQPEQMLSPGNALEYFQKANVRKNEPREHFVVSRMEGNEELESNLSSLYKDPRKNLRAPPMGLALNPLMNYVTMLVL